MAPSSHLELPPQTLTGKVAIVTGATRGIGAAIALCLARQGARVVITYTSESSTSKAEAFIRTILSLGNRAAATSVRADLSQLEAPAQIVKHTQATFGPPIDILVNNAGVERDTPLANLTLEDYSSIYDVNVRGVILLTQAVRPHLRGPARIINVSSVGARQGFGGLSVYCSSKAAVEGLTRCWADELGGDGTTVNAVAPGPVQSAMLDQIPKEMVEMQKAQTAVQRRVGNAEEVAEIVAWLAGERSGWVSGQTINASGGFSNY